MKWFVYVTIFQYLYGINQGGMDDRELEKILASAEQLRLREFEEVFPGSGQRAQGLWESAADDHRNQY